jgi:hypothetical protein
MAIHYDMKKILIYALFLIFILSLLITMTYAQAQTTTPPMTPPVTVPPGTPIVVADLIQPWLEYVMAAVAAIIAGLMAWIASVFAKRTGVEMDATRMQTLQTAITMAAGKVIYSLGDRWKDTTVDVRSKAIKDAIIYVNGAAPDAIKRFGLGPEDIAAKITAKLGVLTAPSTNVTPTGTPKA